MIPMTKQNRVLKCSAIECGRPGPTDTPRAGKNSRTEEGHVLRRMTRAVPGQKREDLSTTGHASLHDPGPRTSYSDNAALSFAQTRVACLETPSQGNIDMT